MPGIVRGVDRQLHVAALQEVYGAIEELSRKADRLLASGDDQERRAFVTRLLDIVRRGVLETDSVVAEGVEVGTAPDSLRCTVRETVCESWAALQRILDADTPRLELVPDPRIELFAGETGAALRTVFQAAAGRLVHLREVS